MAATQASALRLAFACAAAGAFVVVLLVVPDRTGGSAVAGGAGLLAAALVFVALAARRAAREAGRCRSAWALLAASGVAFAAGQCAWAYQQLAGSAVPFPSWAEALFLAQFPLAAAGILCLATGPTRAAVEARAVVDGLLVAASLLLLSWKAALEPSYVAQSSAGTTAVAVGLAFPLAHVVVLTVITVVAARDGTVGHDLGFVAGGVTASAIAYGAFAWLTATGAYFTGHVVDAGWVLAFGLMSVAASGRPHGVGLVVRHGRSAPTAGVRMHARPLERPTRVPATAVAALPVTLTTLALLLLLAQTVLGSRPQRLELSLGVGVVALLLTRQWLSLREHTALMRQLEQRVAQRTSELAASRQRYASVLDSVQEVIVQADVHGNVTFLSRAWTTLTGSPAEAGVGRPLGDLVDGDDRDLVVDAVHRVVSTGKTVELQCNVPRADASTRRVEAALHVVRDERGEPVGISGTLRDLTERLQAQDALRASEERWRLLLQSSGEGILGMGLDGRCTFSNAAAVAMLGLRPEQIMGRPLHALIHHTHANGKAYDVGECPLLPAVRSGRGCHLEEEVLWRADRTSFPAVLDARPVIKDGVVLEAVVTFTDVTDRRAAEREAQHRALHDPLTELPNRTLLSDRLAQAILGTQRSGAPTALMVLDLDGFKDINDRFGHSVGDEVLREVARRLGSVGLRADDTVARLGGDEFAVVLPGLHALDDALAVAQRLVDAVRTPLPSTSGVLRIGCSLGIAVAPEDTSDAELLLQRADVAMYLAKSRGGGVARYHADYDQARISRLELADELRDAIASGALTVHYQPIVDLRTGAIEQVEALCRWHSPTRGEVPTQAFIDVAEQAGLIFEVTAFVMAEAHRQSREWCSAGCPVSIAINISASTLHDPRLLQLAYEWHHGHGPAGPLAVEVTESAVMASPALAVEQLQLLAALGVRVSIDDFGTGYSSLAQLRDMPVHAVKIDRTFLAGRPGDERGRSIIESIIQLGHTLELTVIAEGVETAATAARLRQLGCDRAQGWHFGRPQPAEGVTSMLEGTRKRTASADVP